MEAVATARYLRQKVEERFADGPKALAEFLMTYDDCIQTALDDLLGDEKGNQDMILSLREERHPVLERIMEVVESHPRCFQHDQVGSITTDSFLLPVETTSF